MYIFEEYGIMSRTIHNNSESLFGLCPAPCDLVKSNTGPIEIANRFFRAGRKIKGARKVALAKTKRANKAGCKTKSDDVTNDEDTEDNEAAADNGSEALESSSIQ